MIIQACYSVYNDERFLEPSLIAIRPFVDRTLVVDGSYTGYPTQGISTDRTKEICHQLGATYLSVQGLGIKEKMSCFFISGVDWYIHVDADEIPIGRPVELRKFLERTLCPCWGCDILDPSSIASYRTRHTTRIMACVPGMHYWRKHHEVWTSDNRTLLYPMPHEDIIDPKLFALVHLHNMRDKGRLKDKWDYVEGRRVRDEG
jgi:hypothetical protein